MSFGPKAQRKPVWIFLTGMALSTIAAVFLWPRKLPPSPTPERPAVTAKPAPRHFKPPSTLAELMKLTPAELDHCDVALMDLLCTQGLPGSEKMKVPEMLATIDRWAKQVDWDTQLNSYQFVRNPKEFDYSEGRYRMMALVTVLDKKFRVQYNPALKDPSVPGEIFYGDSRNVFINGLLGPERTGTCSSMPVLYIAVGRRLGYPLYLAETKDHLFAQWNDGKEHFNIECTSWGYADPDDDYYKKWPIPLTDDELKENRYIKPLSGAEELSALLENRGLMLVQDGVGDCEGALACFEKARELTPQWPELELLVAKLTRIITETLHDTDGLAGLPQPSSDVATPGAAEKDIGAQMPQPSVPVYVPVGFTEEEYLSHMPAAIREQMMQEIPNVGPMQRPRREAANERDRELARQLFQSYRPKVPQQLSGDYRPAKAYDIPWYIKEGIVPVSVSSYGERPASPQSSLQIN